MPVSLDISEARILAAANQLISLGLKDAGYEYVNLDVSLLSMTPVDLADVMDSHRIAGRK